MRSTGTAPAVGLWRSCSTSTMTGGGRFAAIPASRGRWSCSGRSIHGVPFLRPAIVLLYKSKHPGSDDQADFRRAAPPLAVESRWWLRTALQRCLPGHPWLDDLWRAAPAARAARG